jgi:hypothetical protein
MTTTDWISLVRSGPLYTAGNGPLVFDGVVA